MRDVFVVGSGRSGTSLVAGCLRRAGYFQGEQLYPPRDSNPRGFFEAPAINALNEELLDPLLVDRARWQQGQRWLATVPMDRTPQVNATQAERIHELTARRPFCFKDPRFHATLPCWQDAAPDAVVVCVFRHPAQTAASIVRECRSAAYLSSVHVDEDEALRIWTAQYRRILEWTSQRGEWHFLHYEEVVRGPGLDQLARWTGAEVDRSFPMAELHRNRKETAVPEETTSIYRALCDAAARDSGPAPQTVSSTSGTAANETKPHIAVIVDTTAAESTATIATMKERFGDDPACGVEWRVLGHESSATKGSHPSAATRWASACPELQAPFVLWTRAPVLPTASGLRALRAELESDVGVCAVRGQLQAGGETVSPDSPDLGMSTTLLRRECLDRLDAYAFYPALAKLRRELAATGTVRASDTIVCSISPPAWAAAAARARIDEALIDQFAEAPSAGDEAPLLSVLISTYSRRETLVRCLESFARQLVPPGSFEIVLTDDDSPDGTRELMESLQLPVPFTFLPRPRGDLASARNATIEAARGEFLLFVNDDTIAWPNLVGEHLRAHHAQAGKAVAVLGSFDQPPDVLRRALPRVMEYSSYGFPYEGMENGQTYNWHKFWTANVSVPAGAVRSVGGFDETFSGYGAEDTDLGLRLGRSGVPVLFHAEARAFHDHVLDIDDLARRQHSLARANVRFFQKHPEELAHPPWNGFLGWNRARCRHFVEENAEAVERLLAAARTLADVDLAALEGLGEAGAALAQQVENGLRGTLQRVDAWWWKLGFLEGFEQLGIDGFDELANRSPVKKPMPGSTPVEMAL